MIKYLYKITELGSGKQYIGVSTDPKRRLTDHRQGRGSKFLRGKELKMQILACARDPLIDELERKAIKIYNTLVPNGYNKGIGGEGGNITDRKGVNNTATFLTEIDVINIRELGAKRVPHKKIAEDYGLQRSTVSHIIRGDTWTEVGGPLTRRRIVTNEDLYYMLELRESGMSTKQISEETGFAYCTVWRYCR